jgi:hypothetical protein
MTMGKYLQLAEQLLHQAETEAKEAFEKWRDEDLAQTLDDLESVPLKRHEYLQDKLIELRQYEIDYDFPYYSAHKNRKDRANAIKCLLFDRDRFGKGKSDFHIKSRIKSLMLNRMAMEHLKELLKSKPKERAKQQTTEEDAKRWGAIEEAVSKALENRGLLDQAGKFTGKSMQVRALYDVLVDREYFGQMQYKEKWFADWFLKAYGFSVSDRTLRQPSTNPDNAEKEKQEKAAFKALINRV